MCSDDSPEQYPQETHHDSRVWAVCVNYDGFLLVSPKNVVGVPMKGEEARPPPRGLPGNGLRACFLVVRYCGLQCVYIASSVCMSGTQYLVSAIQAGKVSGPTFGV